MICALFGHTMARADEVHKDFEFVGDRIVNGIRSKGSCRRCGGIFEQFERMSPGANAYVYQLELAAKPQQELEAPTPAQQQPMPPASQVTQEVNLAPVLEAIAVLQAQLATLANQGQATLEGVGTVQQGLLNIMQRAFGT